MRFFLDLIIPQEEIILEAPQEAPVLPIILGAAVAVIAAVLIYSAVRKKK